MRKRTGLYLILFLVLAVVGLAAAHYRGGGRHKDCASQTACCSKHGEGGCLIKCGNLPCPGVVLKAKSELELTDSQVTKLKALSFAAKKAKVRIKANVKILKLELTELLDKKAVDKAAVDAKVDEIAKLSAQCTKDCIQSKLDTRELLTEEQLKKLEGLKATCPLPETGSEAAAPEGQAGTTTSAKRPKCGQKT